MLVFSAIMPHTPILFDSIGKENTEQITATIKGLQNLEEEFYSSQPDTVIVLTPHGQISSKAFVINFSPKFTGSLAEFGDLQTKFEYSGDSALCQTLVENLKLEQNLQLTTEPNLDYGTLVPLHFLTAHYKTVKIIPIHASEQSLEKHFELGKLLADEITKNSSRIAVIASVELSHKLSKASPDGYATGAKKFDQKIIDLLKKKNFKEITELEEKQLKRVGATEIKSLATLLGILSERNYTPELISYEGPLGVGYLVMNFEL